MGKNKKQKASEQEQPQAEAPPEIPISSAPLPLAEMDARVLGELFELTFPDKKLLELCAELRLYSPGYRLENMPPNHVARMLADEARSAKDAQALLDRAVRETLRDPAFEKLPATAGLFQDALDLFTGDPLQHLARLVWRAYLEKDEEVRKLALSAIDLGLEMLDQSAQKHQAPRKPQLSQDVQELRSQLAEARRRSDRAEKERDSAREQLGQARAETAEREKSVADARAELAATRTELGKAAGELSRLTDTGAVRALSEARKSADEARALADRLKSAQAENERLAARTAELEKRLQQAATAPLPQAQVEQEEVPSEEEAATFLIPFFTREFYDSIVRWDRRMQRAAFDKVALLARDWRHGSLRALALEGLPGYYRIRIATDVRLIYRRGEGNTLEILSLIDREDLDRYVRQARTR